MISFTCPTCRQQLQVSDAAAGRSGKCPHCKGPIQVPAAGAAATVGAFSPTPPLPAASAMAVALPAAVGDAADFRAPAQSPLQRVDAFFKQYKPWSYVAAGGVATLLLVLFLVLAIRLFSPSTGISTEGKYFPSNTNGVIAIDMQEFINSPLYKDMKRDIPGFEKSVEEGFGQVKINDVLRVTFAGDMSQDEPVQLVRVRSGIQVVPIKTEFPLQTTVGRYTVHYGNRQSYCEVERGLVMLGPLETVKSVLQRDKAADLSPEMKQVMAGTDFRKGMAMAFSFKDLSAQAKRNLFEKGKNDPNLAEHVESMKMEITFDSSNVTATGLMKCKDAKSAETVRKASEGMIAFAKLAVPQDLADVLDAWKLANRDQHITADFRLDNAKVMKGIKAAVAMGGKGFLPGF